MYNWEKPHDFNSESGGENVEGYEQQTTPKLLEVTSNEGGVPIHPLNMALSSGHDLSAVLPMKTRIKPFSTESSKAIDNLNKKLGREAKMLRNLRKEIEEYGKTDMQLQEGFEDKNDHLGQRKL